MTLRVTFDATCIHCNQIVFRAQPQISGVEVRSLQHHLFRGCAREDAMLEDLARLLLHFRVVMRS